MKKIIFISLITVLLVACGGNTQNKNGKTAGSQVEPKTEITDASLVNVYYFHGKQRCKTCIAVGNIAETTLKEEYAQNPNVKFIEVQTEDETNAALVEKYQVTWNALIIAKEDDTIEITKQAFASALNNPEKLVELIKTEVNKRL